MHVCAQTVEELVETFENELKDPKNESVIFLKIKNWMK